MKTLLICFASATLSIASAATHRVTLYQAATVNGTALPAGDYRVDVEDNKAVFKRGKVAVEAPVRVETAEDKFARNSIRFENNSGTLRLREVSLGGTNQKLIILDNSASN